MPSTQSRRLEEKEGAERLTLIWVP
jgi:hypothetical protein